MPNEHLIRIRVIVTLTVLLGALGYFFYVKAGEGAATSVAAPSYEKPVTGQE